MNFEFHYHLTGIIAKRAGFSEDESSTIAYASQLVDDNYNIIVVKDKKTNELYSNYISQTKYILQPKKTLMRIYLVFHFVPGNPLIASAARKDGKIHLLNTIPNNDLAQTLMYKAFNSKQLYRIGIATHAYVDTWAHQNFVGVDDNFNGFDMNPIPNVGHADMLFNPDLINHTWVDSRLVDRHVDNNDRFMSAAEHLFDKYTEYLKSGAKWQTLKKELLEAINVENQQTRLYLYSKMAPWLLPYNDKCWFDKAIRREVRGLEDPDDEFLSKLIIFKDLYWWKRGIIKEKTDWFKFQEAVKDHQAEALPLINNACKLAGTDFSLI